MNLCSEFPDLVENLKKGQMLIPKTFDENAIILTQSNMMRFTDRMYTLTLTPTMKCNFVCPYCYEINKTYPKMERELINRLKLLFEEAKENHEYLSVAWYGGEPLLGYDIIRELSQEAIKFFGEKYFASVVTNGYLLNDEIINGLESLHIKQMQITLDGPPEIHNSRRKLPSGGDTFFVILKNIKRVIELAPNVKISIRANTDKENMKYIDQVLDYLEEYELTDHVGFYLAPVDNINETCNTAVCFNNTEFAKEQLKFIEKNLKKGYNFLYLPQVNFGMCGAVSASSFVIDAVGDIFKCWDDVAQPEQKIGNILEDKIQLNENLTKWLSYDIREDKECMNCSYLPVCMGGCPNYRLKNKGRKCMPIKENARELIRVLYEVSKNGEEEELE